MQITEHTPTTLKLEEESTEWWILGVITMLLWFGLGFLVVARMVDSSTQINTLACDRIEHRSKGKKYQTELLLTRSLCF